MAVPVSLLNTLSLPDFTSLTEQQFIEGESLVDDYAAARSLFVEVPIPKNSGSTKQFNEVDSETYAAFKAEGADAKKARVVMGYSLTMTKRRFAKEIDITFEMRDENRHPEVVSQLTNLSTFCWQRMAIDLTHRLTFATAVSYADMDGETVGTTVGDGLALVSAVHTLSGSATTYSNVITGNPIFSKGGFQIARDQANKQILSNFGEFRVMNFDTVVTGDDPATIDEVNILKVSTTDPTQNNPGVVNSYRGSFRHVILPRLATTAVGARDTTKDKYWAYIATSGVGGQRWEAYFGIWEAPHLIAPAPGNNAENVHSDTWSFGTRVGYGICTVSPKGFLLSTGVGA